MDAQVMACTNFVRMHSKLKCVRESRRQRTHARAVAAATVRGWPARRRDGRQSAMDRTIVTRHLHAIPRILMHRNDATGRPPATPI
ncbi:hypothetical protein [Burkholderia cenocepacia]|uniref:hypothetical protein n=1 Tax=Burkholderia cenocepacia TaxID=95486 RepID=UPI002010FB00|nr:hypothetical protein [Burkholderia cenocepacia]